MNSSTHAAELSWEKAKEYYRSFGEGPALKLNLPMLEMIAWVEQQGLTSELFVRCGLSGLWISDRPHNTFGGHMLHVEFHGEFLNFSYERTPHATDGMLKTVKREEVVESLRQFLNYKFGIYRKIRR